jgi:hypothetical protein
MTAIDPADRPTAADLEIALRQALVSPESAPAELAEEHTRVLPAPPSRRPSSFLPAGYDVAQDPADDTAAAKLPGRSRPAGMPRRSRRILLASALVAAGLLGGVVAVTAAVSSTTTPDVVTYPTVTGTLGDHLVELQKSVEP